jgi:hypothetical protein
MATDLLTWIRRESSQPLGVPMLGGAVEHLENATRALLVAQERVAGYLATIGLGAESTAVGAPRDAPVRQQPATPKPETETEAETADSTAQPEPVPPLRRWWAERVGELTGHPPAPESPERSTDSTDLLRRVSAAAGSGDRDRLRRELSRADVPAGLGLAALAPTAVRRLATDLLGRRPTPEDLKALSDATGPRTRELLPNLPPDVPAVLLGRACGAPPEPADPGRQMHPADSAITGAILAGVLLHRLGRDPATVDRYLAPPPEPAHV